MFAVASDRAKYQLSLGDPGDLLWSEGMNTSCILVERLLRHFKHFFLSFLISSENG